MTCRRTWVESSLPQCFKKKRSHTLKDNRDSRTPTRKVLEQSRIRHRPLLFLRSNLRPRYLFILFSITLSGATPSVMQVSYERGYQRFGARAIEGAPICDRGSIQSFRRVPIILDFPAVNYTPRSFNCVFERKTYGWC